MKRSNLAGLALAASMLAASAAWAADANISEVYQAANSGHLDQAQQMMQQVLRDHPDSAKAHYVEAELLVREGRLESARGELGTAERLAPGLPFAKPESVAELRQHLGGSGAVSSHAVGGGSSGTPLWFWLVGAMALFLVIRIVRGMVAPARPMGGFGGVNPSPGTPPGGGPGYGGPGYGGPGYGPAAPGMGSGILGGLATGAAVGAGVVAGEALMHRVLDGSGPRVGGDGLIPSADAANLPEPGYDMGGNDFGVTDDSSWDSGGGGGGDLGSDNW